MQVVNDSTVVCNLHILIAAMKELALSGLDDHERGAALEPSTIEAAAKNFIGKLTDLAVPDLDEEQSIR